VQVDRLAMNSDSHGRLLLPPGISDLPTTCYN
jgi:hypothetical protein